MKILLVTDDFISKLPQLYFNMLWYRGIPAQVLTYATLTAIQIICQCDLAYVMLLKDFFERMRGRIEFLQIHKKKASTAMYCREAFMIESVPGKDNKERACGRVNVVSYKINTNNI